MSELIMCVRYLAADNNKSFKSSRCGITWREGNDLKSVVFNPHTENYSVCIQDLEEPSMRHLVTHIFVSRWAKWKGIPDWYQVWRTHVDVWPAAEEAPFAYVKVLREEPYEGYMHRYAFEHVGGPQYITPEFMTMELAAGSIPEAHCDVDLIPERKQYAETCDMLHHPGLYPLDMGITGMYEDLLVRHREPVPVRMM